jgi:hypothetical protein
MKSLYSQNYKHSTESKSKRRWFQYSLRTLLIFVTLCAVACSWLAVKMRQARIQREAVEAILKTGCCMVVYDYEYDLLGNWTLNAQPHGPVWMRNLLGIDFFNTVIEVGGVESGAREALSHLKDLPKLQTINFVNVEVIDDDLKNIQDLTHLQEILFIGVVNTKITDHGLVSLKRLTNLQGLHLTCSGITDNGLKHLMELSRLQQLSLYLNNNITDAGIKDLQKALPKLKIVR